MKLIISSCLAMLLLGHGMSAQGAWTALNNVAPDVNGGVMILLSDGSVIAKNVSGGPDGIGNGWNKLTPDLHGSYINGTWSSISPMADTRLYFSSRLLRDGTLYVAGGEYGTGKAAGELYDPVADAWAQLPSPPPGDSILDANSELLPDGRVLQAVVKSTVGYKTVIIFNPATAAYTASPSSIGSHDESSWVLLPDNSVLQVDINTKHSERYIPSLGHWVNDAAVSDSLYDHYGSETGPSFLLPDGRAFFIGGSGNTAYYTPSGTNAVGSWANGPHLPGVHGAPDAAAAMMPNGKLLITMAPAPNSDSTIYVPPTTFYEFDYLTNTYTKILAPDGTDSLNVPCYVTNMLDLPDGNILFSTQGSDKYYIYTPGGIPVPSGKPTISQVTSALCSNYTIKGTLFNGISEGAVYGDDWQMATNYPIVRLTSGTNVYYARTFNWNSTGVFRGSAADSAQFALPSGLPVATYSLVVIANGISSDPVAFSPCVTGIEEQALATGVSLRPNPAEGSVTVSFHNAHEGPYTLRLVNALGQVSHEEQGLASGTQVDHLLKLDGLAPGIYTVVLQQDGASFQSRLVVQ